MRLVTKHTVKLLTFHKPLVHFSLHKDHIYSHKTHISFADWHKGILDPVNSLSIKWLYAYRCHSNDSSYLCVS